MDLGIRGRKALVTAASKGLGRGCAEALAEAGCDLVINARGEDALAEAAKDIGAAHGVKVTAIAGDITTEAVRARVLDAAGAVDILVTNAGGPPPGTWTDWSREDFIRAFDANMLTPIALIRAVIDGMAERRFGRIVNITSSSVKAPIAGLDLSSGARAGLTAFVAGIARTVADRNVTINGILPGSFDTDRLKGGFERTARTEGISIDEARQRSANRIPAKRFGTPDEFGALCAFLCSAQAGYITGQSILIDGGVVNATF